MSHNSNNLDKNLKLMGISSIALIILFFYTIYKSSSYIQSSTYIVGIIFLIALLVISLIARFYRKEIQAYILKKRSENSKFNNLLKEKPNTSSIKEQISSDTENDFYIDVIKSDITFDDVAGISSIKEELIEIVDFLNNPKKYSKFDVKLPKGVLLVGPPGVGKTLIARAVAGEANVPFFYQSGASFVQIYVGMGAKRVRELFLKAKANAPAIIFIDEIDAIGKARTGTSNDEREATLNELLTQMDGFEGDNGVIVIAATNKVEVLDDALLRAGRFDRRVHLSLPNIEDRKKILDLYLKNTKYTFDLEKLCLSLAGFSSAALSTLINEAKLNMIKRDDICVNEDDILNAKNKLEFGKKENKILNEQQREILAIYQASKAYITKEKTSLLQEGFSKKDTVYPSKSQLFQEIKAYLAGSIGVCLIKNEEYAVNSHDLKLANNLAVTLVNDYKMANNVEEVLHLIKDELKKELSLNINTLNKLTNIMLEKEIIREDEI